MFMENVGRTLREKKQQRGANELKYRELTDDQAKQDAEIQNLILAQEENQRHKEHLEAEKAEIKAFLDQYAVEKEKRDKLMQIYRAEDGEALTALIDSQLRKVILDGELKRQQIGRAEKKLENLRQGSPALMSDAAGKVIEYIRRCHGINCVFGGDYLKDASDYDRKILLERIPFLPGAVILESGLSKIKEDRVLREMDFDDGLVPVVSLAQVMRQEEVVAGEEVLFLSQNPEWYKDASVRREACQRLERALEESRSGLERLKDREQTMEADKKYMIGFMLNFQQDYPKKSERWSGIGAELNDLEVEICRDGEALKDCEVKKNEIYEELKRISKENEGLDDDIDVLEQMKALEEHLTAVQSRKVQLEASAQKNAGQQKLAAEKLQWAEETGAKLAAQKKALRDALEQMETRWHSLYEAYYVPGDVGESDLTGEEIDARFGCAERIL